MGEPKPLTLDEQEMRLREALEDERHAEACAMSVPGRTRDTLRWAATLLEAAERARKAESLAEDRARALTAAEARIAELERVARAALGAEQ